MTDNGNAENFWDYISRVHSICYQYINEDCSMNAHKDLGINYEDTMSCVTESFGRDRINDYKAENKVLRSERTYWNNYGANFYPSIVINNRTYRGAFEPEAVFDAICAGFASKPSECKEGGIFNGVDVMTVVYIVIGLILFNICLLYCYRRVQKREMQEDMKMQVNSAVSQYFALS